jgi:hypothetical protein
LPFIEFLQNSFVHPERQISVFLVGVSGAFLVPVYSRLLKQPGYVSGPALCVGTALASVGVLFGSAIATIESTGPRILLLSLWTIVALVLAAGATMGMLVAPNLTWRIAFALTALAPLASVGLFWIRKN